MKKGIDDKMLNYIRKQGEGYGGCDEWEIARAIFPFDDVEQRHKKGAWIRCIVQAGIRLQEKGLAGSYMVRHGMPGYNAWQSRIWFARTEK